MGKPSRNSQANEADTNMNAQAATQSLLGVQTVDKSLASLFASSSGPVKAPPKARYDEAPPPRKRGRAQLADDDDEEDNAEEQGEADDFGDDEVLSSINGDIEDDEEAVEESEIKIDDLENLVNDRTSRKRKHNANADDVEGRYLLKLAKEEEKEEAERRAERQAKRQKLASEKESDASEESEDVDEDEYVDEDAEVSDDEQGKAASKPMDLDIPLHESLAPTKEEVELEKSARTVFLANVASSAITSKSDKKILLDHMASFLESLPVLPGSKTPHKVESIRFRSTAYGGAALPKKAAFAKKQVMDATTKSTNAYVVYSTAYAAREAVKRLNATIVLDRHLRVDGVAHPAQTDHHRCVFVGNLGFVDDESMMDQGGDNERKRSKIPSDVEEGLWRQFGKAGKVESVRVVRDEKTRVGKGFAYVQFEDGNSVEAALLFHEKKYPPMLPRILRVTRAKAVKKTALASQHVRQARKSPGTGSNQEHIYNPKISSQEQSLLGRAGKLLGKAGAAKFKRREGTSDRKSSAGKAIEGIAKTPETIIFEGHRATAGNRPKDLKLGGAKKKGKGKPQTRSSKRGGAWKKGGGKHTTVA